MPRDRLRDLACKCGDTCIVHTRTIGNALVDGLYKAADTHIWNKPGQVSYRIISGTRLLELSAHCLELNSQELEAAEYFESLLFDAVDMNQPTSNMT